VSAGASQALELVCAVLVTRDDTVLVDAPTYHLALRILGDHAGSVVPVPDLDQLDAAVAELRAAGRRVPLLYLVPTYGNPTGASLRGRAELVAAARRLGLTIVEDDTYRELSFTGEPPVALYDLAGSAGPVVRIGSFAKSVAPGLRLGWVNAPPALITQLVERGYVFSGGGVNHATALAMAEFGASGAYDAHLARVRTAYAAQRDALVSALRADAPGLTFEVPGGGWFVWVRLPAGRDAELAGDPGGREGAGHHGRARTGVESDTEVAGVVRIVIGQEDPPHVVRVDEAEDLFDPSVTEAGGARVDDHRLGALDHE